MKFKDIFSPAVRKQSPLLRVWRITNGTGMPFVSPRRRLP